MQKEKKKFLKVYRLSLNKTPVLLDILQPYRGLQYY